MKWGFQMDLARSARAYEITIYHFNCCFFPLLLLAQNATLRLVIHHGLSAAQSHLFCNLHDRGSFFCLFHCLMFCVCMVCVMGFHCLNRGFRDPSHVGGTRGSRVRGRGRASGLDESSVFFLFLTILVLATVFALDRVSDIIAFTLNFIFAFTILQ